MSENGSVPAGGRLAGRKVVVGVCGGIAAYKAAELVRLLVKAGAEPQVVMTRHAQEFVTPLTFQTLSGQPVHTELFNLYQEKEIGHISLADRADAFVVAPATANLLAKLAHGLADDLLSTTLLATKAPLLLVPAMNVNMWEHPATRENLRRLEERRCRILEPATGLLACGWEGKGKMPEPPRILEELEAMLSPRDLAGETVLVTAGPTREPIDPIRFLSNRSSGRMGYALARAAVQRGARVLLVSGPTSLEPPAGVELCAVETAEEMLAACLERLPTATLVVKAAAVSDFSPGERAARKIKKGDRQELVLGLRRAPDVLAELGRRKKGQFLVGFAAETEDLEENARKKLREKNLDLIVANDVGEEGSGFDVETNRVRLLLPDGSVEDLPLLSKTVLAHRLLDRIAALRHGEDQ